MFPDTLTILLGFLLSHTSFQVPQIPYRTGHKPSFGAVFLYRAPPFPPSHPQDPGPPGASDTIRAGSSGRRLCPQVCAWGQHRGAEQHPDKLWRGPRAWHSVGKRSVSPGIPAAISHIRMGCVHTQLLTEEELRGSIWGALGTLWLHTQSWGSCFLTEAATAGAETSLLQSQRMSAVVIWLGSAAACCLRLDK